MVKEAEARRSCCRGNLLGRPPVVVTRRRIARGVVMRDDERTPVVSQYRVEDLAYRELRPVGSSFRHGHDLAEPVRGVADEDDHSLSPRMSELSQRDSRSIVARA